MLFRSVAAPLAILTLLSSCAESAVLNPEVESVEALPVMAWDHRPEADEWTEATLDALEDEGAVLLSTLPKDIETWCPNFVAAPREERAAFWAGLFSTLAEFESTWNPRAVGGGGRWFGLVQIDPATARGYKCDAQTGEALRDGEANLQCAVRIAAHQVADRGSVSRGMLDWGPFHSASLRAEMREWVSEQEYCQASAAVPAK